MNVYLVGLRGTGKSTLAPLVADRLGLASCDIDRRIEKRAGCPIASIFETQGEQAFRELESAELTIVSGEAPSVVATGGGIVLREENRWILRTGFVVWLQADVDTLFRRMGSDRKRPSLTGLPPRDEIARLHAEREPLYREVAHHIESTNGRRAEEVADGIAEAFFKQHPRSDET